MFSTTLRLAQAGLVVLAIAATGLAAPAFAAGGDSGGGSSNSNSTPPVDCKKTKGSGWTWSETKKECVKTSSLDDKSLYQTGHDLAIAGAYEGALEALNAIRDKNDAMVLTMIGYSKRKLGALDEGIAIYHQALAIDPKNINTHEYLGEGYIDAGRIDLAEAELDTLQGLCGTTCEQYQDLQKAIVGSGKWN